MSKKVLALLMVLAMTAALAACGGSGNPQPATTPASTASSESTSVPPASASSSVVKEKIEISWGSSSTGGGFYYATGVIAPILTEKYDYMNVTNIATGASADNVKRILMNEIDFGMAHASDVYEALFTDSEKYAGLDKDNLRLVTYYMPGQIYFTTLKKDNITSLSQLAGKSVACGQPGSGAQANADRVLDTLGIDCKREYMQFEDAGIALTDGHISAISTTGIPLGAITELSNTQEIRLLSFTQDEMDKVLSAYPFYYSDSIPVGAYRGVMEPVPCPHVPMVVITRRDIPDYVIEDILTTIYDPDIYAALGEGYGQWKFTKPGLEIMEGTGAPIHPAAVKFFEENPMNYDWSAYGNNGYTNFND